MGNTQGQELADLNSQQQRESEHGGANAEENQIDYQYTERDLEFTGSLEQDKAYGEIKIYSIRREQEQENDNPDAPQDLQICTKTIIFDTKEDCKDYIKDLKFRVGMNHPHLVRLIKQQQFLNSNFCTNIYKVDLAYEYYKTSLRDVLLNRFENSHENKEFFDDNSIFDLIEQVMSVLYYFKENGIVHGDIQPRTILIDQNHNFKLTDIRFLTGGQCGYMQHLYGIETECFLAPELLQKLRRQTILDPEEIDYEKADIFSLGLVALAMGTLQNVDSIYDSENCVVKEAELLNLLEIIKNQYCYNLYLLLVMMLNQQERRITLDEGLQLIDQMRNGTFSQEEFENRRFQSEIEQSDKKMAESTHRPLQYPHSPSDYDNNNNAAHQNHYNEQGHEDDHHGQYDAGSNQQIQNEYTNTEDSNEIPDFDPNRSEKVKRSRIKKNDQNENEDVNNNDNNNVNNNNSFNNQNNRNQQQLLQQQQQQQQQQHAGMNESNHNNYQAQGGNYYDQQNQQASRGNTLNSDFKKNQNKSNNQIGGQPPSQTQIPHYNQSEQKSDRFDNHQFNNQNSNQKNVHNSQQYQNMNPSHPQNQNQASINDIEQRFREAIFRSQQVSLKFENSPLRLFRDQLLADELYVPLDPQFYNSSLVRSKNLESSGRKNQLSQSNKLNYSNNVSQNFSAQKNTKKNDSTQKLVQKKWKI